MRKETIEEVANKYVPQSKKWTIRDIFIDGAKWQQERSYSEEEVLTILHKRDMYKWEEHLEVLSLNEWFEQFKNK